MPEKVTSAQQAHAIAVSFIRKNSSIFFARPKKAVRDDGIWLVEIDVGAIMPKIAKVKVDASSGEILEYDIP